MIKAISFPAAPAARQAFLACFEGALCRDIATLEEEARFAGIAGTRYVMGVTLAPSSETATKP